MINSGYIKNEFENTKLIKNIKKKIEIELSKILKRKTKLENYHLLNLSNDKHKKWVSKKLLGEFKTLSKISITIWGLTYKPYTSSLRRSLSVELCNWLIKQDARINRPT